MEGQVVAAKKKVDATAAADSSAAEVEPRDIDEDDVCPVCQEELLAEDEPLTHCRYIVIASFLVTAVCVRACVLACVRERMRACVRERMLA